MATFPVLSTQAISQYPTSRGTEYRTQVLRFVDGSEQRFRQAGTPVRRWRLKLSELSSTEISEIENLFRSRQGQFGSFSFTDPWTETVHEDCSFEDEELVAQVFAEGRESTYVVIRSNT